MDTDGGVCRSTFGSTTSYFCSLDEIEDEGSVCGKSPLCSTEISSSNLWPLTCPHEKYPCGANSPEIELREGLTLTLRVNKLFDEDNTCYYHIYATDRIDPDDLDTYNRKYL